MGILNKEYVVSQLKKHIESEIFELLHDFDCIIAGGVFTSILTNKEVNDIDVYFKDREDFINVLKEIKSSYVEWNGGDFTTESEYLDQYDLMYLGHTDKSITFKQKNSDILIQFIHQDFYEKPKNIFKDFDFTINMFAYDLKRDKLIHHKDAMQHLAQRVLITNGGTKFPMMSILRVDKYKQRGYSISKKEMMKLILSVNDLCIDSYEDVLKHMGGMYSLDMSKIFNQDEPFSIVDCIEQLCNLEVDPFAQWENKGWSDFVDFIDQIEDMQKCLKPFSYVDVVSQSGGCVKVEHNIKVGDLVEIVDTFNTDHRHGIDENMLNIGDIFSVTGLSETNPNEIFHGGFTYSALDLKVIKSA